MEVRAYLVGGSDQRFATVSERRYCNVGNRGRDRSRSVKDLSIGLNVRMEQDPRRRRPPRAINRGLTNDRDPYLLMDRALGRERLLFFFRLFGRENNTFFVFVLFSVVGFNFISIFAL